MFLFLSGNNFLFFALSLYHTPRSFSISLTSFLFGATQTNKKLKIITKNKRKREELAVERMKEGELNKRCLQLIS